MGYRSIIMINNDAIGAIEADPAGWWRAASEALGGPKKDDLGTRGVFGFRGFANYFQAVWCEHADSAALIELQGGARVLAVAGWSHDREVVTLRLLREAARRLGYRLVREGAPGAQAGAKP